MESGSLGCTSERKRSAQEKTQVQRATRFSVHMPVRYRAIGEGEWREGHTENISRTGVLFWVDSLGSAELAPRSCRHHPQVSVSPRQPRDGSHSLILSTRPGCCRVSPPQPLFESSVQGPNLLVTTIQEHARQTGARSLIGSRAVKDYFLLRRQAVYVLNKLRRRDSQGSGHRHVGTQKGVFGAQIHDQNFIP